MLYERGCPGQLSKDKVMPPAVIKNNKDHSAYSIVENKSSSIIRLVHEFHSAMHDRTMTAKPAYQIRIDFDAVIEPFAARQIASRRVTRPIYVAQDTSAIVAASRPKIIQFRKISYQQMRGTSIRGKIARYAHTIVNITAQTRKTFRSFIIFESTSPLFVGICLMTMYKMHILKTLTATIIEYQIQPEISASSILLFSHINF